jgi:hypothetical protein
MKWNHAREIASFTFRGEDMFLIARAVIELDVELFRDGVHCWDLVCPCPVVDDQAVGVSCVLFVCEESYPLHECTFNLSKTQEQNSEQPHIIQTMMSIEQPVVSELTWPKSTAGFRLCPQS